MYILLNEDKTVGEIIPTFHPDLPGVPIEQRYPADFVSSLLFVEDSVEISEGLFYDEENGIFTEPPVKEHLEPNPEPTLSPADLREQAYNTEAIIEWDDGTITVTQAVQLWQYYAAEGSAKADELSALIATAKQSIREKYPDLDVTAV